MTTDGMTDGIAVRRLATNDPDRWLLALTERPSFLSTRFPIDPADTEAMTARAERVAHAVSRERRKALAEALARTAHAHGSGPEAVDAALSLADPETVCVVTGQQPGVLLSPLYSLVKAAGTVAQARRLARCLGRRVIPVFWTATEDHDVGEVERVRLPAHAPGGEMDFHLWHPIPPGRYPVGGLDIRRPLLDMADRIEQAPVLPGPCREDVLGLVRELAETHATLGDHFIALLNRVFLGTPLVVLDPMDPALRALVAPMFARLLAEGERVEEAVQEGSQTLLAVSGEDSVQAPWRTGETGVFYLVNGQRAMLERVGDSADCLAPRGHADLVRRRDAWVDEAAVHPERFSSDVHLRPLIQETLLPVLAVVLGPGETRYWAQLPELFTAMDLEMPPILPRARVTVVPPHVQKLLGRLSLTVEQVVEDWEDRLARALEARDRIGIPARFDRFEADLRRLHRDLLEDLAPLGKEFLRHGEPNLTRLLDAAEWLRAKANKAHREGNEALIRQFRTAGMWLAPHGEPQDRYWSGLAVLAQEGIDFGARLAGLDGLTESGLLGVWTGTASGAAGEGESPGTGEAEGGAAAGSALCGAHAPGT